MFKHCALGFLIFDFMQKLVTELQQSRIFSEERLFLELEISMSEIQKQNVLGPGTSPPDLMPFVYPV